MVPILVAGIAGAVLMVVLLSLAVLYYLYREDQGENRKKRKKSVNSRANIQEEELSDSLLVSVKPNNSFKQ